jgi:hypothetical protein
MLLCEALLMPVWASAADFCVHPATDAAAIRAMLKTAGSNGDPVNTIRFEAGAYRLDAPLYYDTSSAASDHGSLILEGGYDADCVGRKGATVLDGANRVMPLLLELHANDDVHISHLTLYRGSPGAMRAWLSHPRARLHVDATYFMYGTPSFTAGGLSVLGEGDTLDIRNSIFIGNHSQASPAAVIAFDGKVNIINNTVTRNRTDTRIQGQPIFYASAFRKGANFTIANNIFWGNSPGSPDLYLADAQNVKYTVVANDVGTIDGAEIDLIGNGNLSIDPEFDNCGVLCFTDMPLKPGSPLVDAGAGVFIDRPGARDITGLPRVLGAAVDMGAYEVGHAPMGDSAQ